MKIKEAIDKLKQLEKNAYDYNFNNKVVGIDVDEFENLIAFCCRCLQKQLKDNKE